jgi:hypothetical protein
VFSPDVSLIVTASQDHTAKIIDVSSSREIARIAAGSGVAASVTIRGMGG